MKLTRDYKLICLTFALTLALFVNGTPVAAAPTKADELAQLLTERNSAPSSPNKNPARPNLSRKEAKKNVPSAVDPVNSTSKAPPQRTTKSKTQIPVNVSRITGNTAEERIKNALAIAGAPLARNAAVDAGDLSTKKRGQGMKATQKAGLERLQAATAGKGGVKLVMGKHGVPSHLAGVDVGAELPEAVDTEGKRGRAKKFLRTNKELLRVTDPDAELTLKKEERDPLGKSHYRFQQTFQGIPVYGRESLVHLDAAGNIYLFQGHHLPTPTLPDVTPIITRDEALAACAADLGKAVGPTPQSELVVYYNEPDETNYLAWHIDVYPTTSEAWRYFVDAKTGKIITKYSTIMNAAVPASGIDLNGVRQDFTAWQSGSTYYCYDVTRPYNDSSTWAGIPTARGDIQIYDGRYTANAIPFSASLTTGWDPAAISVVSNIYKVLDYYQTTHQRIGIDGNAGHVKTFIHQDGEDGNAFWNGSNLAFGDDQSPFLKLPGSLDVVAHEMAHGITQYTADLEYQNQSGALNESMSDFFAAMVDRDDWLIGEDVYRGTIKHLRDMRNPHNADDPQPATMSEYEYLPNTEGGDWGGVHANSGIPNRAAYLVAEGLSAEGLGTSIGKDKTEKIWYLALTQYLSKYSTFWHARGATEQAAIDLFGQGSPETTAIQAAWDAVEVNDSSSDITNAPTSADPIIGEDRLVYVSDGDIYEQDSAGTVFGPLNYYVARETRPAVYYGVNDTFIFYVTAGVNNLWAISLNTGTNILVDDAGYWWSLAASPDSNNIAFTKNFDERYVYVYYVQSDSFTSFALYNPTTGTNSQDSSTIIYADALSFDYRSRYVIYDYLNSVPTNLGTDEFWRIGILDIRDGTITVPVTDSTPNLHVGNPVFAANNDFVIAFDAFDAAINASAVFTLNKSNGKFGFVLDPDLDGLSPGELGRPSFRGDDNAISMQSVQTVCPFYCYEERKIISVPLTVESDGSWSGVGASAVYLTSEEGQYPVMYRAGMRILDARLSSSASQVSFGTIGIDKTAKTFTLSNTGNVDLFVSHASLTGADLTLSGTLGRLPRNATMPITITLDSTGLSGARTGSLTITSDADTPTLTIPISATIQPRYRLTVTKNGTGSGSVNANTSTLVWVGTLGTANYFSGAIVTLTALPAPGAVFTGWSGACTGTGTCQVTMSALKNVTATFSATATPTDSLSIPPMDIDGAYIVTWLPSSTQGATYTLEEATNADFTIGKRTAYTGTANTVKITLRIKGRAYYYRVRTNKTGLLSSGWTIGSNDCKVGTPALPSTVKVPLSDADGNFTVSWIASSTPGVAYILEEATNPTFTTGLRTVGSTAGLSFDPLPDASNAGIFYYRVRVTKAGFYDSIPKAAANPCKVGTPVAPVTLTVPTTDPDGNYAVSWNSIGTGVSYTLEEATNADFTTGKRTAYTGIANVVSITLRAKGRAYYYRIKTNKTGWFSSGWTNGNVDCKVGAPVLPTTLTVPQSDADGNFTISWSASPTLGVTYLLEESTALSFTENLQTFNPANATNWTVTGRNSGMNYYYRLKVQKTGFADSAWKKSASSCKVGSLSAPFSLIVPTSDQDGNFTINWTASPTSGVSYQVQEATNNTFTAGLRALPASTNTSIDLIGRTISKTYYYRVRTIKSGFAATGWVTTGAGCKIGI